LTVIKKHASDESPRGRTPHELAVANSQGFRLALINHERKREIVPRTVDFPRFNLVQKLRPGKLADSVRKILTKWRPRAIVPGMRPASVDSRQ
jgi:hypothetical protein